MMANLGSKCKNPVFHNSDKWSSYSRLITENGRWVLGVLATISLLTQLILILIVTDVFSLFV